MSRKFLIFAVSITIKPKTMKKLLVVLVALAILTSCESRSGKRVKEQSVANITDVKVDLPEYVVTLNANGQSVIIIEKDLVVKAKKIETNEGKNDIVYSLYVNGEYVSGIYAIHTNYIGKEKPINEMVKDILSLYGEKIGAQYEPFVFK